MTLQWNPEFEKDLEAALDPADDRGLIKLLSPEDLACREIVMQGITDLMEVVLIYIAGFSNIQDDGPLAAVVNEETRKWVKSVGSRSPWTLGGVVAHRTCSILEYYLAEIGVSWFTAD